MITESIRRSEHVQNKPTIDDAEANKLGDMCASNFLKKLERAPKTKQHRLAKGYAGRSPQQLGWFEASCYNQARRNKNTCLGDEFSRLARTSYRQPRVVIYQVTAQPNQRTRMQEPRKMTQAPSNKDQPPNDSQNGAKDPVPERKIYKIYSNYFSNDGVSGLMASGQQSSIGFYKIEGKLGSGNFSQVKLATHVLTKEKVAIKVIEKTRIDSSAKRLLFREISVLEKLHHPNIVRLYEVIENLTKLHLVMEYAAGGNLYHWICTNGVFNELETKFLFSQIVAAVNHMHEMNIVHRDIKGDNILFARKLPPPKPNVNIHGFTLGHIDFYKVKLADFGFSKTLQSSNQALTTFCGSPAYAAPELFFAKR
ncbi:G2-specific protein kinase nim-1 [Cichlidogyrus casuarinus]|uniref:non-specific serine/threonine protein kinase n=1 Tax=Cichlidogyrus casuarinus TaxID=1844966 RepID=A0ABD2PUV9_9PLAT